MVRKSNSPNSHIDLGFHFTSGEKKTSLTFNLVNISTTSHPIHQISRYYEQTNQHRYNLKETLPELVWTYLTSSVKKSSLLPKRLMRLSEIWLNDFHYTKQDWASFTKKFKTLIYDYILRNIEKVFSSSPSS